MARLSSVIIRRFKRLEAFELILGDVTLLVGANNAGKSSVLQAIHFAVSIAQTAQLVGEGVAWQKDKFELSFNPSRLLYSPGADVLSLATGGALQEPRQSQIEIELCDDFWNAFTVGLRRGRNRNIAVSIVGRQIGERLMDLAHPFTVYAPGLPAFQRKNATYLAELFSELSLVVTQISPSEMCCECFGKSPQKWDSFVQDMQSIFGQVEIDIEFDEETDEWIEVYFRFAGGPRLQVDAAGTSVLQASQILAYIALFQPQVLILDEPDSHLHPDNQRALCKLVFRLATERGFQALISHTFQACP